MFITVRQIYNWDLWEKAEEVGVESVLMGMIFHDDSLKHEKDFISSFHPDFFLFQLAFGDSLLIKLIFLIHYQLGQKNNILGE